MTTRTELEKVITKALDKEHIISYGYEVSTIAKTILDAGFVKFEDVKVDERWLQLYLGLAPDLADAIVKAKPLMVIKSDVEKETGRA